MALAFDNNSQFSENMGAALEASGRGMSEKITCDDLPEAQKLKSKMKTRSVLSVICIVSFITVYICFLSKNMIIGIIPLIISIGCALGIFVILFTMRTYFKNHVVKKALEKYLQIDYLRSESSHFYSNTSNFYNINNLSGPSGYSTLQSNVNDIMMAPCNNKMLDFLNINVQGWNSGKFNDEIKGVYNGMAFRFLDIELNFVYSSGKNTKINKIYGGQAFIFRMSEPLPIGIIYQNKPGEDYSDPSGFAKAFDVKPAIMDEDLTDDVFAEYRRVLETPVMVETLMRLSQLWKGAVWSLKIIDGLMIFVINRDYVDLFELKKNFDMTMAQLNTDLQEFVEVIQRICTIDSLH